MNKGPVTHLPLTGGYRRLPPVTAGYRRLPLVTAGFRRLPPFTAGSGRPLTRILNIMAGLSNK
eukprot:16449489-Heterocapsa_arctica.AAC.1